MTNVVTVRYKKVHTQGLFCAIITLMEKYPKILIVDDDAEIRSLLKSYLHKNQYRTDSAADGREMFQQLQQQPFDLIVLDLMMPGDDGLTLCRKLRAQSTIPIIMLTAKGDEMDRIIGLEMGADDYLPKPFNPRELLARIKTVLRRANADQQHADTSGFSFNGWQLNTTNHQLTAPDNEVIAISHSEYSLLKIFLENAGRILSRDQLLDLTKGRSAGPFDRAIDVQVGRLRKQLKDTAAEPAMIKTARGEGYIFIAHVKRGDV